MLEQKFSKIFSSKNNKGEIFNVNNSIIKSETRIEFSKIQPNNLVKNYQALKKKYQTNRSYISSKIEIQKTESKSINQSRIFPLKEKQTIGKLQQMARHVPFNEQEEQCRKQGQIQENLYSQDFPKVNILKPQSERSFQRSRKSSFIEANNNRLKVPVFIPKSITNQQNQKVQYIKNAKSNLSQVGVANKKKQSKKYSPFKINSNQSYQNKSSQNSAYSQKQQIITQKNQPIQKINNLTTQKLQVKRLRKSSLIVQNQKQFFTPNNKTSNKNNIHNVKSNTDLNQKKILNAIKINKQDQNQSKLTSNIFTNSQLNKQKTQIPSFIKFKEKKNQLLQNNIIQKLKFTQGNNQIQQLKQQKKWNTNHFQIKEKLGKGAFGDVFLARQLQIGFLCVLKKLSKKKIKQKNLEEHLLRQIKIQTILCHKHLTNLYGVFDDQNYIYLILQYLCEGSLAQKFNRKKCSEVYVSLLLKQICQGLKYMHIQSILHRDIKPQNIFLFDDYVKIGDFGCAVRTDTSRNTVVGSLAYISPQQLNNQSYNDKIDIWSIGVLCFQLLTGKAPFEEDIIKIVKNQKQAKLSELKFPLKNQISEEAKDFISRLLQLNPENRLTILEALKHPFISKAQSHQFFNFLQKI